MKKILLISFISLFLISLISAQTLTTLGTFKQNEVVRITQVCQDATYINISSVSYPNSTNAISNIEMISAGSGEYYYDFNDTNNLGRYDVRGISDGCTKTFATYFEISPSGQNGVNNIVFMIILIVIIYGISLFGFFGRNETMTILGGLALMFLGLYTINNGLIVYRDDLTRFFSIISIAWGAISSIVAGISLIESK